MATEATEKSSIVDEKSENVQSEGKIQSHEYSVPITGTQNNKKKICLKFLYSHLLETFIVEWQKKEDKEERMQVDKI